MRTGDHRPDGSSAALAPGIMPGEVERTVLRGLRAPIANLLQVKGIDYDGNPIRELIPPVPIPERRRRVAMSSLNPP